MRRLHWLQHVPFEDLGYINQWSEKRDLQLSHTGCHESWDNPDPREIDYLIVMGGPMNIYEETKYPWLTSEKKFIENVISLGKPVIGICLGAQLIADVLGGRVTKGPHKEIGWHPVSLTEEGKQSSLTESFPDKFTAFHWHGDTFEIPPNCNRLAESDGCANQAFEYDNRVIALQFHLESTENGILKLINNCSEDMTEGTFVQNTNEILNANKNIPSSNLLMEKLLNKLT